MPKKKSTFPGFGPAAVEFLTELSNHNDKAWFDQNKDRYEAAVREPALAFVREMGPRLQKISPTFVADDRKSGGSLMRIYRDVRFSKDKTPYKTNIGIQFRHEVARDVHAPGFYVHIAPHEVFFGVGAWHPDAGALHAIRSRIAERPDEWQRVKNAKAFRSVYSLHGDCLKRPPRGFDADHPHIEDLKRKDFLGLRELDEMAAMDANFYKDAVAALKAGKPLMAFLCNALDLPF